MFMAILSFLGSLITGPSGAAVGELGLALVSWFIQRSQNNAAARGRFLELVQQFESDKSFSAGIHARYEAQLSSVDAAIDAELAKEAAANSAKKS
jgi:hypothetical protein